MQVSLQYAEEHMADLASAARRGEDIEIADPGEPLIKLVVVASPAPKSRRNLRGSGIGKIWMSDDFDSSETNLEIAKLFEGEDDDPAYSK